MSKRVATRSSSKLVKKKGPDMSNPRFLTMTRTDFLAFEYLCRQDEATRWLKEVIREDLPYPNDISKSLQNGVVLCHLVNVMWPDSVKVIHPANSKAWKHRENINNFLEACIKFGGLKPTELFSISDLSEKKNMPKVLETLRSLAQNAEKGGFKISWPEELPLSDFSSEQINEAKKLEGVGLEHSEDLDSKNVSEEESKRRIEEEKQREEELKKIEEELEKKQKEQAQWEEEQKRKEAEQVLKRKQEEEELHKQNQEKQKTEEINKQEEMKKQEEINKQKQAHEEFLAEKYGGENKVKELNEKVLELQKRLDSQNEDGNTLLHLAIESQDPLLVKFLLEEKQANPNASNANSDTPSHLACLSGNVQILQLLIKAGSNLNVMNKDGDYPIHVAVANGKGGEVIETIIKEGGGEVDCRSTNLYETPLLLAIRSGNVSCVDSLLANAADFNAHSKNSSSVLHLIAERGDLQLFEKIVTSSSSSQRKGGEKGEKQELHLNAKNFKNNTPLHVALENNRTAMAKVLIELAADVNLKNSDGNSPAYLAAANGDVDNLLLILSKGADPNQRNEDGYTLLHVAAAQGHGKVVAKLVKEFNADLNVLTDQGHSPLLHAVVTGRIAIAEFLLGRGADVNLSSAGGWKPIHAACFNESVRLTTLLVNHKADLNAQCDSIRSYAPLHILISTEVPPFDLIKLLIENGASLTTPNDTGATPLHLAAFWNHLEIAKLLVEFGAPLDVQNNRKRSPLVLAALYSNKEIAEFLAEKMGVKVPPMKEKQKKLSTMRSPQLQKTQSTLDKEKPEETQL